MTSVINQIRNKTVRAAAKKAIQNNWRYRSSGSHIIFQSPTGNTVTISGTPSDHRAEANIMADLRKAGLDV